MNCFQGKCHICSRYSCGMRKKSFIWHLLVCVGWNQNKCREMISYLLWSQRVSSSLLVKPKESRLMCRSDGEEDSLHCRLQWYKLNIDPHCFWPLAQEHDGHLSSFSGPMWWSDADKFLAQSCIHLLPILIRIIDRLDTDTPNLVSNFHSCTGAGCLATVSITRHFCYGSNQKHIRWDSTSPHVKWFGRRSSSTELVFFFFHPIISSSSTWATPASNNIRGDLWRRGRFIVLWQVRRRWLFITQAAMKLSHTLDHVQEWGEWNNTTTYFTRKRIKTLIKPRVTNIPFVQWLMSFNSQLKWMSDVLHDCKMTRTR